jgi:peptidyl-prolyl cis-trans isomerase SurA
VRRPLAVAAVLALVLGGCSIPRWVPLIGEKPPSPEPAKPPAASPAPLRLTAGDRPAAPPDESVTDRVLAVVNNDAITLSELQEAIAVYRYENRERGGGDASDELVQQFLTRMIDNRLQIQEAEREKIIIDDAEVDEELTERIKKMNIKGRTEFEALVTSQGLSMDAVKKRIRDDLRRNRIVGRKVRLRVSVTEAEVTQYLEANRAKLETGLSYHARHILVVPEGTNDVGWESARIKAEMLRAQVLDTGDFIGVAKQYSQDASAKDGGDLGTLRRGELAQDIETEILRLEPGQLSAPYRSSLGYHVFKLESKESLEGAGLFRVKQQIREILFRQKYEARLEAWLKEIKQRAIIEVRM